ncbi:VOC family protein [Alkalicoccus luteus]|uniref:Glyoxalase n=1 Tax=Alkalicoccus luteus TaxID=1237094 RepID=A0A969PQR7_9BACI|nr:VOC family protein [Alkalicoccus luteus]NJP37830.1 glyoxalase [Alkalicoccus luteus]
MHIQGLHHAQITIPKGTEQEGREFYCDLLGLKEIEKPDSLKGRGGFWLLAGNLQVHVGTEDGDARSSTKAHLAYRVTSLEAWKDMLQKQGLVPEESVPVPGMNRFEFRDPFGNRVELLEVTEDPAS